LSEGETKFPLILFSHGWMGYRAQNTAHSIMLASHGYIVVALEHPYASMVTVFPDGSVVQNNPNAIPPEAGLTVEQFNAIVQVLGRQWAQDLSFVLDQLADPESEAGNAFRERVNFQQVGAYGHSTGAGAVIQFAKNDARCRSIVGLDPFVRPLAEDVIRSGISQPALYFFSEEWGVDLEIVNHRIFKRLFDISSSPKHALVMSGTKHYDFTDVPLLSPVASWLGIKGSLKGARVVELTNLYLLDFFEHTLKERTARVIDTDPPPFAEIGGLYEVSS
jgi:pimeloyl-ACP methyl ester carboxylesterase